jgi:hypothetical protein
MHQHLLLLPMRPSFLSTLESAVLNGYLVNFPGLTLATLRKHPPHSIATIKGHLDQTRQNVRSTRVPSTIIEPELASIPTTNVLGDADFHPECLATPTHMCFASIIAPTGQIYTDQTGKFILPSSTGNNYIMILYDYDSNYIFVQPFHNRTASCLLAAYKALHQRLCKAGLRPKLQRLDNECSTLLKEFLDAEAIDFQLVPPAVHRRNAAECAIRTSFQNHFIAGLCGVNKDFPLHLWDQLLVQAELTLNLLHGSRINPKLSAWAQVNGTYDYNRVSPLLHLAVGSLFMPSPNTEQHGLRMLSMVGMSALLWIPIAATASGCASKPRNMPLFEISSTYEC